MAKDPHTQHKHAKDEAETRQRHQPNKDEVDEASLESFPASDSPGWAASTGIHKNPKKEQESAEERKNKR